MYAMQIDAEHIGQVEITHAPTHLHTPQVHSLTCTLPSDANSAMLAASQEPSIQCFWNDLLKSSSNVDKK